MICIPPKYQFIKRNQLKSQTLFDTLRRVKALSIRKLKVIALSISRSVWRRRDYWMRIGFAFGAGLAIVSFDQDPILDSRFELRGPQQVRHNVAIIDIPAEVWTARISSTNDQVRKLKELNQVPDSAYWNEDRWSALLEALLQYSPRSIGVALHFGDTEALRNPGRRFHPIFYDKRIVWATQLDNGGRILPNRFARTYSKNSGLMEFHSDRDGILRRHRSW
jgi:hypothetical protein